MSIKIWKVEAVRDVRVEVEFLIKAESEEEAKKKVIGEVDYEDMEVINEEPQAEWDILSINEVKKML